jgi:V/A-type H+/Na+-transporting ATPase subunit A
VSTAARVTRVAGSLVEVDGLESVACFDVVEVGDRALKGEVVAVHSARATAQVHEYTGGLAVGASARTLGRPLSARLGPGLLGGVFDGLLRRLTDAGTFLRGGDVPADGAASWSFRSKVAKGDVVTPGQILGSVDEHDAFAHHVLVPADLAGAIEWVAPDGCYSADDIVARIGQRAVLVSHDWPVRKPRPFRTRLPHAAPLLTGQRVIDILYPIARGSTAAVAGGFGTGKTVLLQQIAKWCDADVIVYVGCGERGNEMADVLDDLARLEDPRTGRPLSERTVLIANTSNMPVMAREASIYTGMTVAEYFRDMGYDVVLIADSTSRWAEAMREFSSRTGELPAEEGYPASLPSALAAFYERAGRVETLGGNEGSVTVVAAVSPPGGDFTEPVTAHTQRFVRCFWSLDRDLAYAHHYPAVTWHGSFSRDAGLLERWHIARDDDAWARSRGAALSLLGESDRLASLAELVGESALPDQERIALLGARVLRESVLQQSALSAQDGFCGPAKQAALLDLSQRIVATCRELLDRGVSAATIEEQDLGPAMRARDTAGPDDATAVRQITETVVRELEALR